MKIIKDHDVKCLVGQTIEKITVQEITDQEGNLLEIVCIETSGGTYWLAPTTLPFKGKKKNLIIDVLGHEQYVELTEHLADDEDINK